MMRQATLSLLAGAVLLSLSPARAESQVPMTPRSLGMAGAYDGLARGQETVFLNPALLGATGTPFWSAAIPQVAIGSTMLGTRFGDLRPMLRFRRTSQEQQDEILGRIPPQGTELRYDLRLPIAAFQVRNFGFGISYASIGQHTVGRDVMELLFEGYEEGRTDYSVGDTHGSRGTFWDFAAAYGRGFGPISIGATAHYYHGGSMVRSRLLEPRFDLDAQDIEIDYRTVLVRGGQGYGVDLGMAYQPTPAVTLSGSVSNVISSMTWSSEMRTRVLTMNRHDFEHESGTALLTRYENSEAALDPEAAPLTAYLIGEDLYARSTPPSVLRLGATWSGVTGTDVGISYRNELDESRLGDIWSRSLGLGVQQRIPYASLRAGFATNMDDGSLISAGVTLGVIQLGAARLTDGGVDGFDRGGWIGTFGVAIRTTGAIR